MRIISGKFRGKKLKEFDLASTRPTLDRVKEAIFNLIQFEVLDASVLDLFAGTGAFGIEAISRGAKEVVLIDNNQAAIKIISSNLKSINCDFDLLSNNENGKKSVKLIQTDGINYLKNCQRRFDIILLDPPYKSSLGVDAINLIEQKNLLNEHGIIIFETDKEHNFNFASAKYSVAKKTYGTVAVYKLVKNDA